MPIEEKIVITHGIVTAMITAVYLILIIVQEIVSKQKNSTLYKVLFETRYIVGFLLGVNVLLLPLTTACGLLVNLWINY